MPVSNTRHFARLAAAVFACGLLYAAAQPDRGHAGLAFVALVPLLAVLRGRSLAERLLLGGAAGSLAGTLVVAGPMTVAIAGYFGLGGGPSTAGALGLAVLFGGGSFLAFAALAGRDPDPLRVAAAWAISEWLRGWVATGMPWALLAHALVPMPAALGAARIGGAWLVSGLVALLNAVIVTLVTAPESRRRTCLLGGAGLLGLLLPAFLTSPATSVRVAADATSAPGWLRVAVVQTVRPQHPRGSFAEADDVIQQAIRGTRADAGLVLWPESTVRFVMPENRSRLASLLGVAPPGPDRWLVGAPRSDEEGRLANAAVLVSRGATELGAHEKTILVPFSERPIEPLKPHASRKAATRAGDRARTVSVAGIQFGPLICYESLFADVARESVRQGADVLVNLTNDAWFEGGRGVEQHFAATVLRAVETGRPLLRSAHGGVTAAVDPRGRVVARAPRGTEASLSVDVRVARGATPYVRLGDLTLLWAPLWLAAAGLRRDARGRREGTPLA